MCSTSHALGIIALIHDSAHSSIYLSVIPLLAITVIVVCISGTIFWMIEAFTLASQGLEPIRFNPGVLDAIWWAFVTMSTVGESS